MPIGTDRGFVWQPPGEPGQAARESCTMQAIISGAVGGGAGLVLGAILAPFNSNVANMEVDNLPMREQFRRGFREMGNQSKSWGKNLMVIGACQSGECLSGFWKQWGDAGLNYERAAFTFAGDMICDDAKSCITCR